MNIFTGFREKYLQRRGQRMLMRGDHEKAYKIFEKNLFLNNSPQNQYNLSVALIGLGRYREADNFLSKLSEQYPDNEMILTCLGETSLMLGKWQNAIDIFEKLKSLNKFRKLYEKYSEISKDPILRDKFTTARKKINLAQKEIGAGNYKKALELLKFAAELQPDDAWLMNNIGSLMLTLKENPRDAYPYFEKAVILNPDNEKFKNNLSAVKKRIR
ncbi:MAG: hypothetical protein CSB55_03230 [Candidatus Cloacimonadota bacterium]|nr:MAG: hypothetical protein CSB55_03230 [Candidatus Cloacimonadota bacterium]